MRHIITVNEVKDQLRADNPTLKLNIFKDVTYEMLSLKDLKAIIKCLSVKNIGFDPDNFDCDDYSFELRSRVRRFQQHLIRKWPSDEKRYTWLFYETSGIHKEHGNHDGNGVITHDAGIQYIDPQTDEITSKYNGSLYLTIG
jgi:hypothetical protein